MVAKQTLNYSPRTPYNYKQMYNSV